ncbi:MAG: DEDD exonuclease domain-containing protein [Actinomycetota bacterium]|nr:DEDD exonuclease domain-containing protein [Actinomycetota bacterium]
MLRQATFDDLGTPLSQITFCIVDLETTGGSPSDSAITEVGAVKVRCGEVQGTFQTLVNPGQPVPAFIRLLTGLSDHMLEDAPPIEQVLPSWIEFARDSVLVAHNARFDVSFLNAALERLGYPKMTNRIVDTAALARKTLAGEVPNNKLATLARYLHCPHQPTHRAYADALATTDVLHGLIERASGWGVTTLEDLLALTFTRMDSTMSKIRLTDDFPSATGIYRFVASGDRTLYVGKATDIRSRVRSYFYGDPRRQIRNLLRETQTITYETHHSLLEAEVAEARAIAEEQPPYNRAGKKRGSWYLKLALRKNPRISAARAPKNDGSIYLGPFSGHKTVRLLIDAVQSGTSIHRCCNPKACGGSAHDQMRACTARAAGEHLREIKLLASAIAFDHGLICNRLVARLKRLAAQQRFEEAEELRRRAALLERVLSTNAEVQGLLDAREIVLSVKGRLALIRAGQLVGCCDESEGDAGLNRLRVENRALDVAGYVPAEVDREARVVSSWLRRNPEGVSIVSVVGPWALPCAARPAERFRPREKPDQALETSTRRSRARLAAPESIA